MKLSFRKSSPKQIRSDVLAVFIHQNAKLFESETKRLNRFFDSRLSPLLETGDFRGKEGSSVLLYLGKSFKASKLLLIGLGEKNKLTHEKIRRAAAAAGKQARGLKAQTLALFLPDDEGNPSDLVTAVAEGAYLSLYRFDKYISKKQNGERDLKNILICSDQSRIAAKGSSLVAQAQIICEATHFARDLANAPGNEIYPETLAKAVKQSGRRSGFRLKVLEADDIAKLGMGGVMGVSQGSSRPPRFLILEYGKPSKNTVVLVGKGVTFDTGGISIKPSAGMSEMKMDMAGAAAVIGTFESIARLKLPVHVVGLIPAVENMPSGSSIRPGDILRHYNGKTSEVDNTDAEGRLILADALAYAEKFKPAAVIDLATLTGACVVALGHHASGMMGNDSGLMDQLKAAGEKTYERVWPLPLYDEYEKQIKSDVADVKNVGGRWAGAITAGWFLKKFIGDYKWVHLDIAGTAMLEETTDYTQRGASGVGVRLLTEFLRNWK